MPSSPRNRHPWPLLLLACAAACLAVSSQSFWIDETQTALKAAAPNLRAWWAALYGEHSSNLQLPFYMAYVWAWARFFGTSELSMRAANIPWFFLGFFAISHFLRSRAGLRNAALLLYCVHPFVWYYLDEARPYIVQLSGALLVFGAVFAALDQPEEPLTSAWWWLFGSGLVVLCGSGILGIPWAAAGVALLLLRPGFVQSIFRTGLPALCVFLPVLAGLAVYFAWTLKEGARPGDTGMTPSSIPFVIYEHFGFDGLGPGRVEMRSRSAGAFIRYLPSLCLLGLPLLYALGSAAAARFGLSPRKLLAVAFAVIIPAGFVFTLGFTRHFLVLGRHLTPLFPFVLCGVAFAVSLLWKRRSLLDRAAVALIIIGLAASAVECRFSYRHRKDDYKDASTLAKAALERHESVWWVADDASAAYYGLPVSPAPRPGTALRLWKPEAAYLATLQPPGMIVLSKPDLFDTNSAAREYIATHGYTEEMDLPAFTFWRK